MPPTELATASIKNSLILAKVSHGEVEEYCTGLGFEWFRCLLCYRCLISYWCFELTPSTVLAFPTKMEQWGSVLTVYVILCRFLIALSKSCFPNYLVFLHELNGPSVAICSFSKSSKPGWISCYRQVYSYSLGLSQLITHWWIVPDLSISDVKFLFLLTKLHKNICNFLPRTSFHTEVWFNDLYKSGYF